MPPRVTKKTKAAALAAAVAPALEQAVVAVPVPVAVVEPVVEPLAVVPVEPEAAPKKKGKKLPKIVATVTPEGIEGSFLPEPRRPLIAHLQISSSEVQLRTTHMFYDPTPPGQPEPYDGQADVFFGQLNGETVESTTPVVPTETVELKELPTSTTAKTTVPPPASAPVGMEAFTKCDLMVEYKELKSTKKIPEKTDIACYWCAHSFTWQPCIIPEREEKGTYRVYGNFCAPNCGMAFLLQESLDTHVRWERIALLHRLYGKFYPNGRIFPSPARECLRLFGGPMDIDTFRGTVALGKVRIDLQIPPMVSILGSIDTKPIDFYDSSMKHTISPLLGENVPKAEEGLRLKRSKPLKEKDSTLDSVLKINIRGRV